MSLALAVRRARLQVVADAIDAAGGGAVHLYGSTRPATGAPSGDAPLFIAAIEPGSFAMHATEASMTLSVEGNVAVAGVPLWARFVDGAGSAVLDESAGLPGSGAPVIVTDQQPTPSAQLWVGGLVTVSWTVSEPE